MDFIEIIFLAIAVAMDAFAVAICKGTTIKNNLTHNSIKIGSWFGAFQGIMPLIGFFFMDNIEKYIGGVKEYIIFILLLYIGVSMILEARKEETLDDSVSFKTMLVLSVATSLDALSIGITLSLYKINIFISITIIALITFLFSYFGVKIGNKFGMKYKSKAEMLGGIILIFMGIKVLIQLLV